MDKSRFSPANTTILTTVALVMCAIVLGGCIGGFQRHKYERTENLQAPLAPGGHFTAQTHNGAITIRGADENICKLTAKITVRARTPEEAQSLAEKVSVALIERDNGLATQINKPNIPRGYGLTVEFDVSCPRQTGLNLETHNGAVRISDIVGDSTAKTHNGAIRTENILGTTELHTYNGKIVCRKIAGDLKATTHNGGVNIVYSKQAAAVMQAQVISHNGGIDFTAPPQLSAKVDISTHNGSVHTDIPIAVTGKVGKNHLAGTIGQGQGKIALQTHNGSIHLK